jgi:hypothetical protein
MRKAATGLLAAQKILQLTTFYPSFQMANHWDATEGREE